MMNAISVKNDYYGDTIFTLPFVAKYQVMNGALALKTMEVLNEKLHIPVETIQLGMKKTRWQGRMEQVLPGVIVDGAHNEDAEEQHAGVLVQEGLDLGGHKDRLTHSVAPSFVLFRYAIASLVVIHLFSAHTHTTSPNSGLNSSLEKYL